MSKQKNRKQMQYSHASQTISTAPNQSVTAKMFSASKDFDPSREIEYWKKNHNICLKSNTSKVLFWERTIFHV